MGTLGLSEGQLLNSMLLGARDKCDGPVTPMRRVKSFHSSVTHLLLGLTHEKASRALPGAAVLGLCLRSTAPSSPPSPPSPLWPAPVKKTETGVRHLRNRTRSPFSATSSYGILLVHGNPG